VAPPETAVKHVSTKLLVLLLACLALGAVVLGYIDIRLHRRDLEEVSLQQAIGSVTSSATTPTAP